MPCGEKNDNSLLTKGETHSCSLPGALHFPTQNHIAETTEGISVCTSAQRFYI